MWFNRHVGFADERECSWFICLWELTYEMRILGVFIVLLLINYSNALASSTKTVSLYGARGVDANLTEIPGGNIPLDKSYLAAIDLAFPLTGKEYYNHIGFDFHLIVAKHWGLQDNFEIDISPSIQIFDILPQNKVVNFTVVWGLGLSYALGSPTYEDGSIDDPDKQYRFQAFMLFDLEVYRRRDQLIRPFVRIHHRSGIYGVVAPERVGSNFIGIGVKF